MRADARTRIAVVVGSVRPARRGGAVARWVGEALADLPAVEVDVFDLAAEPMPLFDEPVSPFAAEERSPVPPVRRWLATASAADGFVFVTPEYNHAPPAALKNALDYLAHEADLKPAAVLAYSQTSRGGCIAAELLKLSLTKLGMTVLPHTLAVNAVNAVDDVLDADGHLVDASPSAAPVDQALRRACAELVSVAIALRDRPPVLVG